MIGLFFLLLAGLCIYGFIGLLNSNEPLGLRIIGLVIIGASAILILMVPVWEHFKKAYNIVTHYSKEERDRMGDLLIGRVQGGKYL